MNPLSDSDDTIPIVVAEFRSFRRWEKMLFFIVASVTDTPGAFFYSWYKTSHGKK